MGDVNSTEEPWLEGKASFPVYYEDTDFSGYVYHANYLKYFERGREELVGLEFVRALFERGIHYVVARCELSYHAPAKHGALIEISTRMRLSMSPVGLVEQEAWSVPRAGAEGKRVKLVTAKIKLVAVDREGQSIRVPEDVAAYFKDLQDKCSGT